MIIEAHDKDVLIRLLNTCEDRLIGFILNYAEQQNYTRYTPPLKEAWRLSIEGLSQAIIETVQNSDLVPELDSDQDYSTDPGAQFGILEAQRHRSRGVTLAMFLGLMKYYRQAYIDLLDERSDFNQPQVIKLLVNRFFDKIEIAYCSEWASTDGEMQIRALSDTNLHLANEKNKYLTLFESLSSPVILCDKNGIVDNYNNAAGRLLLQSSTPGGHYYAAHCHNLTPPALDEELAQIMAEGSQSLEVEKIYQTPEGEKSYDVQIKRMLDISHKFSGYTILFNDITDRLRWLRRLEEVNRSQKQLINDLNQTRQQLVQSEKMAAIGQLSAGIAHEINTPIQYIGENARFLQDAFEDMQRASKALQRLLEATEKGEQNEALIAAARKQLEEADSDYLFDEVPRAINQSLEGVERISTIISAMKVFARPGTEKKAETDINEAIINSVNLSANEWKYHAEIETDLDPALPPILCLPGEVNQALLNIIVNAANAISNQAKNEAQAEKGKISIRSRLDGEWVVIDISDTGPGIPDQIKSKIFDPFFTTKDVGMGTGQGLTVAYQAIVEKHAGEIDVKSVLGGGTTFEIRLPVQPQFCAVG